MFYQSIKKHAARVFYISLVFSNARRVLSQYNTRLRLLYLLIISRDAYRKNLKASSKLMQRISQSRLMHCVRSCCNWDGVSLFMVNMIVKMLRHVTTVVLVPIVLVFRILNFHFCQNSTKLRRLSK